MTSRVLLRLLLALAVGACLCQAQDADITTKSFVVPGKGGRPDIRCENTYRGKKCIMRVMSDKRASGEFVAYARSFHVGRAMVVDSDEDRDGFFETLAVIEDTDDGRTHVEVFRREHNGTKRPVSAEELKKMQDMLDSMATLRMEAV